MYIDYLLLYIGTQYNEYTNIARTAYKYLTYNDRQNNI